MLADLITKKFWAWIETETHHKLDPSFLVLHDSNIITYYKQTLFNFNIKLEEIRWLQISA